MTEIRASLKEFLAQENTLRKRRILELHKEMQALNDQRAAAYNHHIDYAGREPSLGWDNAYQRSIDSCRYAVDRLIEDIIAIEARNTYLVRNCLSREEYIAKTAALMEELGRMQEEALP